MYFRKGLVAVSTVQPRCPSDGCCLRPQSKHSTPLFSLISPEMVIGACVQGIGDATHHPPPPGRDRDVMHTDSGWGLNCDYNLMKRNSTLWDNRMFPLYDSADFRRRCGTRVRRRRESASASSGSRHNAFHFHNWFADVHSIRHKYATYGHAQKGASQKRVKDFSADTAMMHQCALGSTERLANQRYGYQLASDLVVEDVMYMPIYFQDAAYMKKRHDFLKYMIYWDETEGPGTTLVKDWDHSSTKKFHQMKKRVLRAKEKIDQEQIQKKQHAHH
jgi:hypothetical protein